MARKTKLAFGLALAALGARTTPARAAAPVSVWFRTTDGCPSGEAFLARLSAHGVEARVASVGDHIDFVVTLGQKDGESSATLERQSSQGTVALRELRGANCDAVAEALALTLALTVDPDAAPPAGATSVAANPTPVATPSSDASTAAPATASARPAAAAPTLAAPQKAEHRADQIDSSTEGKRTRWFAGLAGTVGTIMSGAPLWGGAGFAELQATHGLMPSVRLSLVGGVATDPIPNVHLNLVAGRFEGCPVFVGKQLGVGACAAVELGRLAASSSAPGGHADASFWSALWAIARLRYRPASSAFSAELQGGLTAPLTRYRIAGEMPPRTLAQVSALGVGLAAGGAASW
jgi:hypothetical protein